MFAGKLDLQQPRIMGVLNVTPDSFSDGGRYTQVDQALQQALRLEVEGADIIDIGGESTRPGAAPVSEQQELDRVLPVIEALKAASGVLISVDTSSPQVIQAAAAAGVDLINDVRSLTRPGALDAAVASGLPVCLMHMRGEPGNMQQQTDYQDVVKDVADWLQLRASECQQAGITAERILLDPGFGFAKQLTHNLQLLARLDEIVALGYPVLAGMSRKRMLGELTGRETGDREAAGLAAHLLAVQRGARLIRVHAVAGMKDALRVWQAVEKQNSKITK
ncbi:dihydropteroate synthase [Marinospirillum alkaliphilum]|uniref:Dihydropteroate synthase n=1 Tax=Marinospirillum alkaliphilum DSM 21637 TaxID=1122209 RepID=A0A1K1Y624_9GAMM|nr:dihydropteroate synthase [Marinospirillum alkaliphilum]SFX57296.1 dihydropteroate synthase [Marinospirillum alkaliphilum DSM 21637]